MVDTALNDHGNLTSDLCDVHIPNLERVQTDCTDVHSNTLTQDVQQETDGATRVAMRASCTSLHSRTQQTSKDKLEPDCHS